MRFLKIAITLLIVNPKNIPQMVEEKGNGNHNIDNINNDNDVVSTLYVDEANANDVNDVSQSPIHRVSRVPQSNLEKSNRGLKWDD